MGLEIDNPKVAVDEGGFAHTIDPLATAQGSKDYGKGEKGLKAHEEGFMVRRSLAVMMLCLGSIFIGPTVAQASDSSTIIEPQNNPPNASDGWQSSNCTAEPCSPETPELFFKKAAGHPQFGFTQYIIQHEPFTELPHPPYPAGLFVAPIKTPQNARTIKTLRVELPAGLTVNPLATERCTLAQFQHIEGGKIEPECPPGSIIGREEVTLVTNVPNVEVSPGFHAPEGFVIPPNEGIPTKVPVYALVPHPGEPALNGFVVAKSEEVFLETDVSWQSDYHESFNIKMGPLTPPFSTLISRQVSEGRAGDGTYITNPTTCFNPEEAPYEKAYSTIFRADSYAEEDPEFPTGSSPIEAVFLEGVIPTGCKNVPFDPEIETDPGTTEVDSPAAATVNTKMPFITGGSTLSESHLRNLELTLPAGMGLNASASTGLVACTDAQFKQSDARTGRMPGRFENRDGGDRNPAAARRGAQRQRLPRSAASRDPTSGEEFRIFIDAEAPESGVESRLIGKTKANPVTGQVTTEINEAPQVPFTSVKLHFDGAESVLTSPPTCAPAETTSTMEPWSTPASTRMPTSKFTLSSAPGGGTCPQTLAARAFAPAYTAASDSTKAAAYSPFRIHIGRPDGQQELKLVNATLPEGLTANLSGIPYCSEAALAAAAAASGVAEMATPSCPTESMIGTATTASGTGAKPAQLAGKVYLSGPYKGAPLSMAVITPAVSGPFDLGTVVVRVALNVDPKTTVTNAVSDTIPDVYGGVKLDIRSIDFNLDRSKFILNPTNCAAQAISGSIKGAGGDATNPAAWSSYPFSMPFQATECDALGFKPKLHTKLLGGRPATKRLAHPKLQATLEAREGDANVLRTAVTLSASEQLDQSHINSVCTNPQLASQTCPSSSVYGQATAVSPLLSQPLKGPVYLVPSGNLLPDMVADLRGQVNVQLHGVIGNKKGAGLKAVFNAVPDVAVKKFTLTMDGGKKGLLVNSRDLCKHPAKSVLNIKGQNGKQVKNNKLPLSTSGCPKRK